MGPDLPASVNRKATRCLRCLQFILLCVCDATANGVVRENGPFGFLHFSYKIVEDKTVLFFFK